MYSFSLTVHLYHVLTCTHHEIWYICDVKKRYTEINVKAKKKKRIFFNNNKNFYCCWASKLFDYWRSQKAIFVAKSDTLNTFPSISKRSWVWVCIRSFKNILFTRNSFVVRISIDIVEKPKNVQNTFRKEKLAKPTTVHWKYESRSVFCSDNWSIAEAKTNI